MRWRRGVVRLLRRDRSCMNSVGGCCRAQRVCRDRNLVYRLIMDSEDFEHVSGGLWTARDYLHIDDDTHIASLKPVLRDMARQHRMGVFVDHFKARNGFNVIKRGTVCPASICQTARIRATCPIGEVKGPEIRNFVPNAVTSVWAMYLCFACARIAARRMLGAWASKPKRTSNMPFGYPSLWHRFKMYAAGLASSTIALSMLGKRCLNIYAPYARAFFFPLTGIAAPASSSNSSASFSVIAPPSCSASTMVTARL